MSLLLGFPLREKAVQLLPHFFIAVMLMMCGALAVGYAGSVRWPLGTIWIRAPIPDKNMLVRAMAGEIARHVSLNLAGAMAMAIVLALASVALGLGHSGSEWMTLMICVNLGLVGLVAQGVGQALVLKRFEMVGTTINWLAWLLWGLLAAWFVPPFEMPVGYATTLMGVGLAWGGLLGVVWYRGFYRLNGYALRDCGRAIPRRPAQWNFGLRFSMNARTASAESGLWFAIIRCSASITSDSRRPW